MKTNAISVALLLILAIPVVISAYAAIQMAAVTGGFGGWAISMLVIAAAAAALAAIAIAVAKSKAS